MTLKKSELRKIIREEILNEYTSKAVDQLESLIDKHSLSAVLEMLFDICLEKAEHIRTSWQDETSAKTWERDGKTIDSIVKRVKN